MAGASWRFLVVVAALAAVGIAVAGLSVVVVPLFLGLFLASIVSPVASSLRRYGVRPALASVAVVLVLICGVGAVVFGVARATAASWPSITEKLDAGLDRISAKTADALGGDDAQATAAADDVRESTARASDVVLHGLVMAVPVVVSIAGGIVLSLLVTFVYLKDGEAMWRWIVENAGGRDAAVFDEVGRSAWRALGGFVRGTSIIAAIDAVGIGLGALVLGVPFPGAIAAITFVAAYVPFIGATVAGIFAVVLAIGDGGFGTGLWMLGVVLAVQQFEGNVLQPFLLGHSVHLHPLVVALVLVAAASLGGILAVFAAVPVTAAAVAAVATLRDAGFFADLDDWRRRRVSSPPVPGDPGPERGSG